ncbi:MAG: bifunctional precorrin-2 dehydrogenase/sirohydrochlorin ferrochelatase [Negativicutes bacterium]|nr:bifunctional precorrin-2 dehydrogenase/sirohydrochlorin ferrochelatase [Negativicutes bacterium]
MEYPVNLRLAGRPCAIVGGGGVAARKARVLLKAQAKLTVIAPEINEEIQALAESGQIVWRNAPFAPETVHGYFIVICATDNADINAAAAREARLAGALVNVVDAPDLCDFTLPSLVVQKDLLIAVSTGGKSPALARRLREELAAAYGCAYGDFLDRLAAVREIMRQKLPTAAAREAFWRNALDEEIMSLLRQGRLKEAEDRLQDAISRIGLKS